MNNFDDDRQLVSFLKQYQPIAPAPALDLQAQIMDQVQAMPIKRSLLADFNAQIKFCLIGAAIATTAIIAMTYSNRQMQPAISEAETQVIEASLVNTWSISTGSEQEFTSSYSLLQNRKSSYE
jgi:hypothetical protein